MSVASLALCASHAPGMNMPGNEEIGPRFRAGIARAAELVADFAPDLVVMFGGDHRRAFREITPTFLSVWDATGLGDYGSPEGAFDVPQDVVRPMTEELVAAGFDLAVGTQLVLDHGFTQTAQQVLGGLDRYPIVPVFINCATPPLPSVDRVVELGAAIGEHLAPHGGKVLYLASGGMSHTPPTLDSTTRVLSDERRFELLQQNAEAAREMVYDDWDAALLTALAGSPQQVLDTVTDDFLVAGGTGAHEVRNWMAAWAAAGRPQLNSLAYEAIPDWFTGMGVVASAAA